ncbi:MAG TPA: hypothetical protein VFB68_01210 [Xanthobacteraceae bacterium]|nr:hypothetical protein [Xanthobacteraceae bacterium]
MRRFDEVALFWNDARARLPQGAWSWPLIAATAGAMFTAITSSSVVPVEAGSDAAMTTVASHDACQGQTWPYLSDGCLRRDRPAAANPPKPQATPEKPQVRVLNYGPEMAAAAVGATPWAPKHGPSFGSPAPQKRGAKRQASQNLDDSRAVTVRSGRNGRNARVRVYVVPGDSAYRAYGYAPR